MWNRIKPAEVVVDLDGLGRLTRDLHNHMGLVSHAHGVTIRVFAQSSGNYLVFLTRDQTRVLREVVNHYEFSDVYGPRDDG
jgi:uncharacterized Rossmann fold enzyme